MICEGDEIRTAVEEEDDDRDDGVDNLLPCLEYDSALLLAAVAVRYLASVEELLAGVCEVVEDTRGGGGEDNEEPCRGRVDLDKFAAAKYRADEAVYQQKIDCEQSVCNASE